MIDRLRLTITRWIGVVVAGFATWLSGAGIEVAAEFSGLATGALTLLAMGVLTVATNWLVRKLGPVAALIFGPLEG